MLSREIVQNNAVNAIIKHSYAGIVYVSPRVGKSKIVCDILKMPAFKKSKILITAPYNTILDSWTSEFEKWKVNTKNITLINQRSLSKVKLTDYKHIICDEIHTLSDNQIVELQKTDAPILGLTGSLSKESKKLLKDELYVEPIFTYSVEDAINDGIVADYKVYLIGVPLDNKDKYIEAGTKDSKFMTTEYANYQYLTAQFEKFKKMSWNNKKFDAVKMQYASKRASMLYTAKSKITVTKKIIAAHNRCLIFTARTETADDFATSYHSKSKEDYLEQFKDGTINKLAVCEMTNMGITIPNLKVGIFHQMKSSEESAIQKVMRMCNVEQDEIAEIYITYFINTIDEEWVKKALSGLNPEKIIYVNRG